MCRKHANDMHSFFFYSAIRRNDQPSFNFLVSLSLIGDQDFAINLPKWIADIV